MILQKIIHDLYRAIAFVLVYHTINTLLYKYCNEAYVKKRDFPSLKLMKKLLRFLASIGIIHFGIGNYTDAEFSDFAKGRAINKTATPASTHRQTTPLPKALLIITYILFGIFFLLALFFGLWAILTITISWIILLFILTRFIRNVVVGIVLILTLTLFSFSYLIFFTNTTSLPSTSSSEKVTTTPSPSLPTLEMTIIQAPSQINCATEKSTITLRAKNVSTQPLSFADITKHRYDFEICDGDKPNTDGRSCFPMMNDYITMDNFGEIKPGETKELRITTPVAHDNAIADFPKTAINGTYTYYISFVHVENPKHKPLISTSNIFTVQTTVMNPTNDYVKVDCAP